MAIVFEPNRLNLGSVEAASTKSTPGGVDGWITIDVAGTTYYIPFYASKTA